MQAILVRILSVLLLAVIAAPAALAQGGRRGEKRMPGPSVGAKAPDLVVNVLQNWPEEEEGEEEVDEGATEAKPDPEKTTIKLSELWADKPVVLIFGSYT